MSKEYQFIDLGLKIRKTLVIADLHLGFEESLNKSGVMIPRFQMKDIIGRLEPMIQAAQPETIVINGDFKHEFGKISETEWRDSFKLIDFLKKHGNLIFIRGNHDRNLPIVLKKRNIKVMEDHIVDGFFITHGDIIKEIPKDCHTIVIGHEHPAVSIREGNRIERFKCFIETRYDNKKLIVLPSIKPSVQGHDLIIDNPISPYLTDTIQDAQVFVVAEQGKILHFGTIDIIKKL
jgi:uncharacterized protein